VDTQVSRELSLKGGKRSSYQIPYWPQHMRGIVIRLSNVDNQGGRQSTANTLGELKSRQHS
jgi:hypothetical protein